MIHRMKAAGLALLAIAMLGALAASAAQAGDLDVPGRETSNIRGQQEGTHTLKIPGESPVECTIATLEGTLKQVPEIKDLREGTLTGTYTGCKVGFFGAVVDMNGCKYTLTGESNGSAPAKTAWVDITGCTTADGIKITVAGGFCTITIPPQNTLSHIVLNNQGTPQDARAQATVSNITYKQSAGCPRGTTHAQDASYTGETTVRAFVDEGEEPLVTHNGHQYKPLKCGAQEKLEVT
jgi:hypothetical protein